MMRPSSIFGRHTTSRNVLAGVLAAGIATSVLYSVAGSALSITRGDDREKTTESRDLASFTKIKIKGAVELQLTAGREQSVSIRTRGDRIDDVTTEVDGDTLTIDMDDNGRRNFWEDADVDVVITLPTLKEIEVLGAVDAELDDIDSEELVLDIRGAADVDVEGTCGTLKLDMKGAGDIDADKLKCEIVEVDVRGAGSASVYASKEVDADVAGVASISVYGEPEKISKHAGGFASISIK